MSAPRHTPGPSREHTPGPWNVAVDDSGTIFEICDPGDEVVADCSGSPFVTEVDAANATLIAAAPEMFERLQDALRFIEGLAYRAETSNLIGLDTWETLTGGGYEAVKTVTDGAREALAKAEGET